MSKEWEHTVSNGIYESTDEETKSYRCGYSGSSKHPQPDVLVTTPSMNYALELKGPIQSDRLYVQARDCEQIAECANGNTLSLLTVKFSRRRPVTVRLFEFLSMEGIESPAEALAEVFPEPFEASVTDGGHLSIIKPSTDEWASASKSPPDHVCILSDLGIKNESSMEADMGDIA